MIYVIMFLIAMGFFYIGRETSELRNQRHILELKRQVQFWRELSEKRPYVPSPPPIGKEVPK